MKFIINIFVELGMIDITDQLPIEAMLKAFVISQASKKYQKY